MNKELIIIFNISTDDDRINLNKVLLNHERLKISQDYYTKDEVSYKIAPLLMSTEKEIKLYIQDLYSLFTEFSDYYPYIDKPEVK